MSYAIPSSSKVQKKPFFKRKMEAYQAYGKALTRPQSNFRDYLIEKRKLNLGYLTRENSNLNAISNYYLESSDLIDAPSFFSKTPLPINESMYVIVEEDNQFNIMMNDLEVAKEFTLDLESNTDHSYYGMTCLLQFGTYKKTYLVDAFSQFENIKTRLKTILESSKILKIVHGGDNDYISCNRDFGISMVGALDLQFLQQQIFEVCKDKIKQNQVEFLKKNELMWRISTDEKGKLLSTEALEKLSNERIGLKKLAKLYFPTFPEPADATLADWRIRPLKNQNMINYAVYDVYVLLHIWNKMKELIKIDALPGCSLTSAVEKTSKLLKKRFVSPKEDSLDDKLKEKNIVPHNRKMMELLFDFRKNRAKIVDENEEELIKLSEVNLLIKTKPTTEQQLENLIQRGRSIPSESIQETSKTLLKLLHEGDAFFQKMKTTKCHVCNGKYNYSHLAWGCVEKYSQQAVNAFMARPENQQFKEREHERRVRKWHEKRGPSVPYPNHPPK